MASLHALPTPAPATTIATPTHSSRRVVGGEGGGGGKGAAARITSVIKCVWESVRGHAIISGLHLLVAPSCSGSGGGGGGGSALLFRGPPFFCRGGRGVVVGFIHGLILLV